MNTESANPNESEVNDELVSALENSTAGIFVWSTDSDVAYLSGPAKQLLGIGVSGRTVSHGQFLNCFHEEDRVVVTRALAKVAGSASQSVNVSCRVTESQGGAAWVDVELRNSHRGGRDQRIVGTVLDATARKNFESVSRESSWLNETIVDYSPIVIIFTDLSGRVLGGNASFYRMLGYGPDDIASGLNCRDLTTADYRDLDDAAFRVMRRQGQPQPFEKVYLHKNGSQIPVMAVLAYLGGPQELAAWFLLELTELKRTQAALRMTEERLQRAQEAAHVGTWEWDLTGNSVFATDEYYRLNGIPLGTPLSFGERWVGSLHPEDRDRALAEVREVLQGKRSTCEYRVVFPDGSIRWLVSRGDLVRDETGHPTAMLGATIDITDRKLIEEQVETLAAGLSSILESTTDCVVGLNADGSVTYANGRARAKLPRAIEGATLWEALGLSPDSEMVRLCKRVIKDRVSAEAEDYIPSLNGWFDLHVYPSGSDGCALYCHDITPRKQAQEALRKSDEQLRHAQKLDAVGKLAGGIAHDFNNLLTVITGYTTHLESQFSGDADTLSALEEIHKAADRAASLTRQLLQFSRKQLVEPRRLDLNAVISGLRGMLAPLIGEAIELNCVLDPDLPSVKADAGQIEQVIVNLALNARDAMPQGGKLLIETGIESLNEASAAEHSLRPGEYVTLTVSDSGTGMDKATVDRIFEPFFTTKPPGKGTGLGLSVVYGIVQQAGGAISVTSESGRGTQFKIYLPPDRTSKEQAGAPKNNSADVSGTGTILLVEDDPGVRRLAREVLARGGYQVVTASSGDEAVALAETYPHPIDLVVTDIVMPGRTGIATAEALRQQWPGLKVLFISGYTDEALVRSGGIHSEAQFLPKPFTPASLLAVVHNLLVS